MTTYTFATFNDPKGTPPFQTLGVGINATDQIVGTYSNGGLAGFLDTNGTYSDIVDPLGDGSNDEAFGINDSGQIVGFYSAGGSVNAFLYTPGAPNPYATIGFPGQSQNQAWGINNAGEIVGEYVTGTKDGWLFDGKTYTLLDVPSADYTEPHGINNAGQVVGDYKNSSDPNYHGFLYSGGANGTFSTIDDPSGTSTEVYGINDSGQIVGKYQDASGAWHGFLYSGGTNGSYTTIDDPLGTQGSFIQGINDAGQMVGYYEDSSSVFHGFFAAAVPAPFVSDAVTVTVKNTTQTTLSGIAEANSSVSVYDNSSTTPLKTVTANPDGTWSVQVNNLSSGVKGVHSFTETSTDDFGLTASSNGVTLYSAASGTSLTGGSGNDFLIGAPKDTLTGGPGNDTFVFNPSFGKDVVTDFDANHDHIAFARALFSTATASQVLSQTQDTKAGAVITVDNQDTITLANITKSMLVASDFSFF
jgi:probable HAF family extracellular repeat protein